MTSQEVFRHVYDNLVVFNEDLEPEPCLAESWETSKDGLEWTFHLRKGVTFHDGSPVNAQAVKFSFERALDPSSAGAVRSLFSQIELISVIDDYTVRFTTKEPFGPMLNYMAHGLAGIVSPSAVKKWGADYRLHPVGAGPYEVKEFVPNEKVVLQRNEDYWGKKPKIAQITFIPVPEDGTRVMMLEKGQVTSIVPVPVNSLERLENNKSVEVLSKPIITMMYVGFNLNKDIFRDIRVRQALTHAVDREALVSRLMLGHALVGDSPLAQKTFGYYGVPAYQYDPKAARTLLAEAGWKDTDGDGVLDKGGVSLRFSLWTPQDLYTKDVLLAQTIQAWWRALGADVELRKIESAAWYDTLKAPESEAPYDAFLWSLTPSTGDGYQQLVELVKSDVDPSKPPLAWNLTHYKNPEVDSLIFEAGSTTDPAARGVALRKAQEIVVQDAPLVFLYSLKQLVGVRSELKGVRVLPNRFVDFRLAYVDK